MMVAKGIVNGVKKMRAGAWIILVGALLWHAALEAPVAVCAPPASKQMGVVAVNQLNFRQEPRINGKRIMILKKETPVEILGRHQDWLKIKYKGEVGFVSNRRQYIRLLSPEIEDYNSEAQKIKRQIARSKAEVKAFSQKESELLNDLYEIEHIINVARKRQELFKTELSALAEKIKTDEAEAEALKQKIREKEKYAHQRLVALYKLSNLGHISLLSTADSVYDFFFRKTALERILQTDETILNQFIQNQKRLQENLARQKERMETKRSLEQKYLDQIDLMASKRVERSELLAYIRNKKKMKKVVIRNLKQAAELLDKKIEALTKETPEEPEPSGYTASKKFLDQKGLLMMPVKGKIISRFGSFKNYKFNFTNFRSGIDIRADKGEPIRAVCDGKILFADWFKGYGNMVIIDHGDSYYTVYAHIEDIFKTKGDVVERGEVVATVGDSGSLNGAELYFEVRHHGKPIDPLKWLKTDALTMKTEG